MNYTIDPTTGQTLTKTCNRCFEEKPATSEFFSPRGTPKGGGFNLPCKECRMLERAMGITFAALQREIEGTSGLRYCTHCCEYLPFTEEFFYPPYAGNDSSHTCKPCLQLIFDEKSTDAVWLASYREYHSKRSLLWAQSNPDRILEHQTKWRRSEKGLADRLWRTYKLTLEVYYDMLEKQGFVCATPGCGKDNGDKRLHVDHDHACCDSQESCGKCVRGLLCFGCNAALGYIRDNPIVAIGLAEYLLTGA